MSFKRKFFQDILLDDPSALFHKLKATSFIYYLL